MALPAIAAGIIRQALQVNSRLTYDEFISEHSATLRKEGRTVSKKYFEIVRSQFKPSSAAPAPPSGIPQSVSEALATLAGAMKGLGWESVVITNGKVTITERRVHTLDLCPHV
jgi:hypothetical protein